MTRKFFSVGCKLTLAAVVTFGVCGAGRGEAGQCNTQGGGGFNGGNFGGPVFGGTPKVPQIPGLPPLSAGSNFPIIVEPAVAKQSTPVKILGNAPIVAKPAVTIPIAVTKPAVEVPVTNVAAAKSVADALDRR